MQDPRTKTKAIVRLMPEKALFDPSPWFVPAICVRALPKYGGSAPGYVFTTVDSNTGYYADDPNGRADRTREALAKPSTWQAILDLVKWPTVATASCAPPAVPDPQPQWAKRASDQRRDRKRSKLAKSLPCESLLNHTTIDSKLAKDMNLCAIDSWNMNAWLTGNEAAARSSADVIALQEQEPPAAKPGTDKSVPKAHRAGMLNQPGGSHGRWWPLRWTWQRSM